MQQSRLNLATSSTTFCLKTILIHTVRHGPCLMKMHSHVDDFKETFWPPLCIWKHKIYCIQRDWKELLIFAVGSLWWAWWHHLCASSTEFHKIWIQQRPYEVLTPVQRNGMVSTNSQTRSWQSTHARNFNHTSKYSSTFDQYILTLQLQTFTRNVNGNANYSYNLDSLQPD